MKERRSAFSQNHTYSKTKEGMTLNWTQQGESLFGKHPIVAGTHKAALHEMGKFVHYYLLSEISFQKIRLSKSGLSMQIGRILWGTELGPSVYQTEIRPLSLCLSPFCPTLIFVLFQYSYVAVLPQWNSRKHSGRFSDADQNYNSLSWSRIIASGTS